MINHFNFYFRLLLINLSLLAVQPACATTLNNNFDHLLLQQGYTSCALKKGAEGYYFVEASFGTQTQYPLLLDTGSAHTTLDPKLMADFDFSKTGKASVSGDGSGPTGVFYQVGLPKLQFGNFTSNNETAFISNHSFHFLKLNQQSDAGILGLDFLHSHQAIIDIANQRLYLKPSDNHSSSALSADDEKLLIVAGYQAIKLQRSPHDFMIINASINDAKSEKYFLDSGCNPTLLSYDYVVKQRLPITGQIALEKVAGGGNMKMFNTTIQSLAVGSTTWSPNNLPTTNFKYIQHGVGLPVEGVIGIDWLKAHHAIIDTQDDIIFIKSI